MSFKNNLVQKGESPMGMLLEHWGSGARWLGCNAIGMLSLWGAGALSYFFLPETPWVELIDRGQFFLYSVGILAQGIFILSKEWKITKLPHRFPLLLLSFGLILVCACLYSGTFFAYLIDSPDIEVKTFLLRQVSIVLFAVSMLVGVWVTIVAEGREDIDIDGLGQMSVTRLGDKVSENQGQLS